MITKVGTNLTTGEGRVGGGKRWDFVFVCYRWIGCADAVDNGLFKDLLPLLPSVHQKQRLEQL